MSGYRELAVERGSYSAAGSYQIVDQGNRIAIFDFSSFVGVGTLEEGLLKCKQECDKNDGCKSFTFHEHDEISNKKYQCHTYDKEITGCEELRYVKTERPDLVNNTQKPRTFYKHTCEFCKE